MAKKIVFVDQEEVISGGNFHGEYPAKVSITTVSKAGATQVSTCKKQEPIVTLKHVSNGTRKVKTQANISAKFALFFVSNCKTKVWNKVREFVILDNFKRLSDNNEDYHEFKCFINRFWTT